MILSDIEKDLKFSQIICTGADYLAEFEILFSVASSAYTGCSLRFGALCRMTTRDSPHIVAHHTTACISIGIYIGFILNDTD